MHSSQALTTSGISDITPTFRLPASLELPGADALHAGLLSRIRDGHAIVIDGSDVERISTACLQVLLAAHTSAAAQHLSFEMQAMSDVMAAAITDLDLSGPLGLGVK